MGDSICGYPILCGLKDLYEKFKNNSEVRFIYSLYRPGLIEERTKIQYNLKIPNEKFCNFIPLANAAQKEGKGVTMKNNKFIGPPMVKMAQKILNKQHLIETRHT